MLVGQAALSFQLWTGELPDPRAVLNVLRADLGSN
jgi:shikimate 5-dehydrogenase